MTRKKQADAPDMYKAYKDKEKELQALIDDMERLLKEFARDRVLLEKRIEGLYDCMSDQHEVNQMLIDRLFTLEHHNADTSASIH